MPLSQSPARGRRSSFYGSCAADVCYQSGGNSRQVLLLSSSAKGLFTHDNNQPITVVLRNNFRCEPSVNISRPLPISTSFFFFFFCLLLDITTVLCFYFMLSFVHSCTGSKNNTVVWALRVAADGQSVWVVPCFCSLLLLSPVFDDCACTYCYDSTNSKNILVNSPYVKSSVFMSGVSLAE